LIQRLRLFGPPEPQQVLLETAPGLQPDALLLDVHGHPIQFPEPGDNPGGGNEGVPGADSLHRSRRKDAGGTTPEGALVEDLAELETLENTADLIAACTSLTEGGPAVSYEQLREEAGLRR
jgi:hypothetical protein